MDRSNAVTSPPPPPRDPDLPPDPAAEPTLVDPAADPTLVDPAARRVVVEEDAGPVVRPYPWWLWVVAGICLAAAIVFLVLWLMERGDSGKDVPTLVGLRIAEAQDRASAAGFTLETIHQASSQPSGVVFDQAPQAGAELEGGAQVMAVVSSGQQQVTVPRVVGTQLSAAERLLTDIGLQPSTESVKSTRPKGFVVAQDPADGTKVPKGSTVTLRVSNGAGQVKVPAVEGMNLNDAVAAIVRAELVPVVIQVPSQQPKGNVLAQDPAPNEQVEAGSKVRLNVSGGPASTQTLTVTTSETTTTVETATTAITTTP
jgi:beta-lactam-binding protein with PASTA domain